MTLNTQLAEQFNYILNKECYQSLIHQIAIDETNNPKKGLCNVLLSFVPENYHNAKHKIMIVGREPRGWLDGKVYQEYNQATINESMQISQNFFKKQLQTPQKGGRFFGFLQKIDKEFGADGLLWANMFVVSDNLTLPHKHPLFEDIKNLSKELLLAQIKLLRPDIIIFANGYHKAVKKARYDYFENLTWSNCGIDNLHKRYLEQCFLNLDLKNPDGSNYQPLCYRTHHPTTKTTNGQKGLNLLIKHLQTQIG